MLEELKTAHNNKDLFSAVVLQDCVTSKMIISQLLKERKNCYCKAILCNTIQTTPPL